MHGNDRCLNYHEMPATVNVKHLTKYICVLKNVSYCYHQ